MPRRPRPDPSRKYAKTRATVVFLRQDLHWKYQKIVDKTGCSLRQAKQWVSDYQKTGQLENKKPGPKGPHKVTDRTIQLIKVFMKGKSRRGTRACVAYLKNRHGISLGRTTVQNILKNVLHLHCYRMKSRPKVTAEHKRKRLEVAHEFLALQKELKCNPWENIAFSDECRFHDEPQPNSQNDVIWDDKPNDEKHWTPRSKYANKSCEVWGAITRFGKSRLFFIERPVTVVNGRQQKRKFSATDYVDSILKPLIPKVRKLFKRNGVSKHDWTFMQDGDPKHRAWSTQNWLAEHCEFIPKEDWPANSPDLNPIENCWSMIWEEVKRHRITSVERLKAVVTQAWKEKITAEYIKKLYDSIPRRMNAVIAADGKPTKF